VSTSLIIGDCEIKLGQERQIQLPLPDLYNTPSFLPLHVKRGRKSGPTVFISACVHGNEIIGIEIIRRLLGLSLLKRLRGTLIVAPVVNTYGFNTLSRYLPDRRDLNRCFPGSSMGSLASRVAKVFFDEVVLRSDFGIDLHTAALHRSNLPQTRLAFEDEKLLPFAQAFEAPVILNAPYREGSLRHSAHKAGIPVLLYEAGEALRLDEPSVRIGVHGIVQVLKQLEMLPQKGSPKPRKKKPLLTHASNWIRASQSGILRTLKKLGDTVEKGEVIGHIETPLSLDSESVYAPYNGIIIGRTEIPLVQEGDALFHVAAFENLEKAEERMEYFQDAAVAQSDFLELKDQHVTA
jgi:predicted deacylase